MASILLSSAVEHDMTQENKTSTDKLHLTNELFYNTAVSYPFTWILTVLIILAGRKYNSAKYFLDLISSSQNVSLKEWIFLCILSICYVFCDYDLRYTVFFLYDKKISRLSLKSLGDVSERLQLWVRSQECCLAEEMWALAPLVLKQRKNLQLAGV